MIQRSPLHDRGAAANQTHLSNYWAGRPVVEKYTVSEKLDCAVQSGVDPDMGRPRDGSSRSAAAQQILRDAARPMTTTDE